MIERFALIGDVHAEDERLEAVLRFIAPLRLDAVLAVGDIVDGPGDLARTIALLAGANAIAVRGNHERWFLADTMRELPSAHRRDETAPALVDWLAALPPTRTLETPRGRLLLCHGVGADDMQRLLPDDEGYALECNDALQALLLEGSHRFMAGGHTHQRMVRSFAPGLTVINPGTLFRENEPCFSVVDLGAGTVVEHDVLDGGGVLATRTARIDG